MSKKKKKNRKKPPGSSSPPQARFAVGDRVQVRKGVTDPDYSDFPWGGWVGVIQEFEFERRKAAYKVAWSAETLAAAHPVYFKRCDNDDVDSGVAWLEETDLEPDPGTPLVMEQPTQLRPRPLDQRDPSDLARYALGLTSDDELPPITTDRLIRFHTFLCGRVRPPSPVAVDTEGDRNTDDFEPGTALRVLPLTPDMGPADLLVRVRLMDGEEFDANIKDIFPLPGSPGSLALRAYDEWLIAAEEAGQDVSEMCLPDSPPSEPQQQTPQKPEEGEESADSELPPLPTLRIMLTFVFELHLLASLMGAVLLSLLEAMPSTHLVAEIAAGVLGLVGGLIGARGELSLRRVNGLRPSVIGGGLIGLLGGAFLGGTLGAVIVAGLGALAGAAGGLVLAVLLGLLDIRWPGPGRLTLFGIFLGALALAYRSDAAATQHGVWRGLLGGLAIGAIIFLGGWFYFGKVMPPITRLDE